MNVELEIKGKKYFCDLTQGHDLSIPLVKDEGPTAYGAEPYSAKPFVAGEFIGSLEKGSPVNFYNVFINPHGNGTHTESVRHIDKRGLSIHKTLLKSHFVSRLVTAKPQKLKNGDVVINEKSLDLSSPEFKNTEALIIRTTPNSNTKKKLNYTGTNPCYVDSKFIEKINKIGVEHLLIDLPSVDKEIDGGELKSHHAFWQTKKDIALYKTITEMIYVDKEVKDGLYLLNIQTIALDIDASPCKPIIYALHEL